MRLSALSLALLLLASPTRAEPIDVFATPVPLNTENPAQDRVGQLVFTGGLVLASRDDRFGGFSGLIALDNGGRIDAVSDRGHRLVLRLAYDDQNRLTGVADADITPLLDTQGDVLKGKKHTDAEAMAQGPDGRVAVAFERRHRIVTYSPKAPAATQLTLPAQFPLMPANGGVEALARLADGRLLALSESLKTNKGTLGWIGTPDTDGIFDWELVTYPSDGHNAPTGAATLPGGDIIVVERRYGVLSGLGVRLRRIPAQQMTANAFLDGPLLADMTQPFSVDNFEAVAPFTDPAGRQRLLILSDDNFSPLQRTLLLSFALEPIN